MRAALASLPNMLRHRARWLRRLPGLLALGGFLFAAGAVAFDEPAHARRSGASFGGRSFGSAPRPSAGSHAPAASPRGGGFFFFPAFLPFGVGGGVSSLLMLGVLGAGAFLVMRSMWPAARRGPDLRDEGADRTPAGTAHVHQLQVALGRSGREVRARLAHLAETGDTGTETGLARLLSQTTLELLRQRDSIRYVGFSSAGPLTLAAAETKLGGLALKERSAFQVERLRAGSGSLQRSAEPATRSEEVLEYIVVTLIVATRSPLPMGSEVTSLQAAEDVLAGLGGLPPGELLGLEVIWTPADADDALTTADLLTGYPNLGSV